MRQGKESLERPAQLIGWHNECHAGERILRFQGSEILNQCRFEGGMKRAGDKTKHGVRASLFLKREAEDRNDHARSPVCASREARDERRDPLARFRAHQFSIAIDAGPISVDELHRFPACTAFRRRALIDHGKIRQFKIVFIWNRHISPILCALRSHF